MMNRVAFLFLGTLLTLGIGWCIMDVKKKLGDKVKMKWLFKRIKNWFRKLTDETLDSGVHCPRCGFVIRFHLGDLVNGDGSFVACRDYVCPDCGKVLTLTREDGDDLF